MTKRILTLGFSTRSPLTEDVTFDSPRSLLEFDVVVVNWDGYIEQLAMASHETGYLKADQWNHARVTLEQRTASLDEFLAHGRLVVALSKKLPAKLPFWYQGSIQGARLHGMVPTPLIDSQESHGTRLALAEKLPPPIRKFAESVKDALNYFAVLNPANGIPVMTIEGTQKPVALWCPHESGGGTLFCPFPADEGELPLIEALLTLSAELCAGAEEDQDPLPPWHSEYVLPQEAAITADLLEMENEVKRLTDSAVQARSELAHVVFLKRLFTDKGDSLLNAAAQAFRELGFSVVPGPIGRDDLILEALDGTKAVVEVKGKDSKGAAEADAAQLEKWVSGFYHDHGVEPKGILVINGHRNIPLRERREPVFPNQMLQYANRKEHCLISGFQLLGLVLAVQQKQISPEEVQGRLLKTIGACSYLPEINDCLSLLSQGNGRISTKEPASQSEH